MRSWTSDVTAFGMVVRIENDFTHCPVGSFQRSQIPAKANNCPSLTSKQNGCLVFLEHCRALPELQFGHAANNVLKVPIRCLCGTYPVSLNGFP